MSISRRNFIKGTAATAAAASLVGGNASMADAAIALPYTADSFFKSKVIGAPIDTASTTAFHNFMATHPDQKGKLYPRIAGVVAANAWGTTFWEGKSTDAIWKLTGSGVKPETQIAATQGFHFSAEAAKRFPTGTQDRPALIVDPIFGYSVHLADAVANPTNRTISCSASAVFYHSSNGLDKRNPRTNDSRNWCSRGRIPDAMVIRGDLVKQAVAAGTSLGHVLQMFFVETDARAGFCHPMIGMENDQFGWGAEGVRIAIRPDVNLAARGITGGALVIAKTLQEYGTYLGDNSGSSSQLKGEQATSTYSPYAGTNVTPTCLSKLTWKDFYVLPKGWQ